MGRILCLSTHIGVLLLSLRHIPCPLFLINSLLIKFLRQNTFIQIHAMAVELGNSLAYLGY